MQNLALKEVLRKHRADNLQQRKQSIQTVGRGDASDHLVEFKNHDKFLIRDSSSIDDKLAKSKMNHLKLDKVKLDASHSSSFFNAVS